MIMIISMMCIRGVHSNKAETIITVRQIGTFNVRSKAVQFLACMGVAYCDMCVLETICGKCKFSVWSKTESGLWIRAMWIISGLWTVEMAMMRIMNELACTEWDECPEQRQDDVNGMNQIGLDDSRDRVKHRPVERSDRCDLIAMNGATVISGDDPWYSNIDDAVNNCKLPSSAADAMLFSTAGKQPIRVEPIHPFTLYLDQWRHLTYDVEYTVTTESHWTFAFIKQGFHASFFSFRPGYILNKVI